MASTLPPDPYLALGVPKDASADAIKKAYRKLVLKCHPDKVTDATLKLQAQEDFHKIQSAWELIGDEEKRKTYEAEVRLEKARLEKKTRGGSGPEVTTTAYGVRTAAPGGASFTATGPHRYAEERRPSRAYDDDRHYERPSAKYETYEAYPRHASSRTSRPEKESKRTTPVTSDRTRSDRVKTRDREERRDRAGKFVYIDDDSSSNDDKARYEAEYRRRSEEERRKRDEEDARKAAAEARRKAEDRRSYEEVKEPRRHRSNDEREFDRSRKLSEMENDAVRYIHRSKVEVDPRPSPSRTSSSRDVRPDGYDSRSSRRERPELTPRRSSAARPKDRVESSGRDSLRDRKGIPEIVEWEDDRRPSMKQSTSSPADIQIPRMSQRSYTTVDTSSRDSRRADTSPPTPVFRRSETMPSSSSRRTEATVPRPSKLRSSETSPREPETVFATVPESRTAPSSSKYYHYPTPGGGVSLRPQDLGVANGHRTIIREPGRHRDRSPSPLGRPPIGANRPVETSSSRTASSAIPPPALGRSATFNVGPVPVEERGRSQRLYGEVPRRPENTRGRQTSFSPDSVAYTKTFGPEDIRWSRGREPIEKDHEYAKPMLGRHATFAY